jgi:hypothetical protein
MLDRVPGDRADVMAYCLGFLDQAVKSYLDGLFTLNDLRHTRDLMETLLDVHREREAARTC